MGNPNRSPTSRGCDIDKEWVRSGELRPGLVRRLESLASWQVILIEPADSKQNYPGAGPGLALSVATAPQHPGLEGQIVKLRKRTGLGAERLVGEFDLKVIFD